MAMVCRSRLLARNSWALGCARSMFCGAVLQEAQAAELKNRLGTRNLSGSRHLRDFASGVELT